MPKIKPKFIIFDLDGTLADTVVDIGSSVNFVLSQFDLPIHEISDYKQMVGDGFRVLVERVLPQDKSNDDRLFDEIFKLSMRRYEEHVLDETKPFPGMIETLEYLYRKGLKLAVLSNKPDRLSKKIIESLFASVDFVAIWGDNKDRARKPDPSAALELCRIAKANPKQSLFVGDSAVDMQTAKAAGIAAVGALYGYRSREELELAGADYLISSPQELLSIVESG